MTKVYVLVCNYCCVDSGDFDTEVIGVYDSYDKAKKVMDRNIVDIRNEFDYCDVEEDNEGAVSGTWSIWEQGEYATHHCDLLIQVKEVQ